MRVRLKKLRIMWEKCGMQPLQDPRKIYLSVFDSRVVSIQEKSSKTQTRENCDIFDVGIQRFQSLASVETGLARTAAFLLSCLFLRKRNFPSPFFCKRYCSVTPTTPTPYRTARRKPMDDASGKYFVGQEISPIRYPK